MPSARIARPPIADRPVIAFPGLYIGLPGGMDGYAVAAALRGTPDLAGVALIALSGYGQEEDQRRALQAGFDRHLTKPVDPRDLTHLLESLPRRSGG